MPVQLKFTLEAVDKAYLPPFTGGYVRGLFYQILKLTGHDKLADKIHNLKNVKPFAVSPLRPVKKKMNVVKGSWILEPTDTCVFNIKILDDNLATLFIQSALSFTEVKMGKAKFEVANVEIKKETYRDLIKKVHLGRIGVNFHTPTFFNILGRSFPYILPDLRRITGNLLKIWNTYADEKLRFIEDAALEAVENTAYIRSYEIKTREVTIDNNKFSGFQGRLEIVFKKDEPLAAPYLSPLIHFAEYSNVGEKRTYGFGAITITLLP